MNWSKRIKQTRDKFGWAKIYQPKENKWKLNEEAGHEMERKAPT
jgi:hypothetical protein